MDQMSAGWPAQLTVSACNRLGQYSSSPGTWSYCYTELAVSRRSWSQCSSRLYPQADNSQLRHWSRGLLTNYSHDNIRLMSQTSLPSNLRPTTRECVRLVMRVTSGHVTKTAVPPFHPPYPKASMLQANFMAVRFIEPELLLYIAE